MKATIEEICVCYWKVTYEKEMKKENKFSESFEQCGTCKGYDNSCKNYTSQDYIEHLIKSIFDIWMFLFTHIRTIKWNNI